MSEAFTTKRLRRATLFVVMAALVFAQTLGLLHRVVHAPPSTHAALNPFAVQVPVVVQAARADVAEQGPATLPWLDRLFAAHGDSGCESYDQLAHADLLWGDPPALCARAVNTTAPSADPAWQLAAQAAGYLARGPPLLA